MTNSDQDDSTQTKADVAQMIVPRGRARALSTGSIDNPAHDETMDSSTDALLLMVPGSKPHPLPKPRRKVGWFVDLDGSLKHKILSAPGSIGTK